MGWVDPYQIPIWPIIKKFISNHGCPETDGEWVQLRQYVEADYESRRDSIALRAQAEAQEINVQSSDVIDDMDGIHIEKDGPFRLPYAIITQGNGKRKGKRNRTRAAQTEADIFVLGTDVLKKRAKPKPRAKKKKENK